MTSNTEYLKSRREFLFAYDIKMGNPNGDPDENRPRVLPSGTHYVTDVRLKRFVRDFLKSQGQEIMVDTVEGKTTNLTGRVAAYLEKEKKAKCQGTEVVDILLNAFIDARLFGSSLAFKEQDKWEPKPVPKTLTGAVQIQHGEVKHLAQDSTSTGRRFSAVTRKNPKARSRPTTGFDTLWLHFMELQMSIVPNSHV